MEDNNRCPISDCKMIPWLSVPKDWRKAGSMDPYHLYWCNESQFGQLFPRPSRQLVEEFYKIPDYYTHHTPEYVQDSGMLSFAEKAMQHIAWRMDYSVELTPHYWKNWLGNAQKQCCDIGCGNGELLQVLRGLGHEVVGVEFDEDAKKVAEHSEVTIYQGTAEDLPTQIQDNSQDLVTLIHVLEHCLIKSVKLCKKGQSVFV